MKPRILWLVAAVLLTSLFLLSNSEAGVVDDLMGYNQSNTQTYTYTATNAVQSPYNGAMQYGGAAAYPAAPATQRRPMLAQQQLAPQAPLPQAQPYAQPQPQRKAIAKKKPVQNAAAANGVRAAKPQAAKQPQQRLGPLNTNRIIRFRLVPWPGKAPIRPHRRAITEIRIRTSTVPLPITIKAIPMADGALPDRHAPQAALEASKTPRSGQEESGRNFLQEVPPRTPPQELLAFAKED